MPVIGLQLDLTLTGHPLTFFPGVFNREGLNVNGSAKLIRMEYRFFLVYGFNGSYNGANQ